MNEEPKEMVNVYSDDNLLIRDVKENDLNLRQLIFKSNPYQIQCEIKTVLTSKTKLKNNKDNNFIPIKTLDKYSQKNLVQGFDDSFISMFYIQALLCGIFFIDLKIIDAFYVEIIFKMQSWYTITKFMNIRSRTFNNYKVNANLSIFF